MQDKARRPRGYRADRPYSHANLETLAKRCRAQLFKDLSPQQGLPDGITLLETMEKLVVRLKGRTYGIRTEVKPLPPQVLAEARFIEEEQIFVIRVSEATYEGLINNEGRARFSICHELGHIVVHGEQLMRLSCIPHAVAVLQRSTAPDHKWFEDTEWQADSFAASFLVPTEGLYQMQEESSGWLNVSDVANTYGVSTESAIIRISNFQKKEQEMKGS